MNKIIRQLIKIARLIKASNYQFAFSGMNKNIAAIISMGYKPILMLENQGQIIKISYFNFSQSEMQKMAKEIKGNISSPEYNILYAEVRRLGFFNRINVSKTTLTRIQNLIYQVLCNFIARLNESDKNILNKFINRFEEVSKAQAYKLIVKTYHTSNADAEKFLGELQGVNNKIQYKDYTVLCDQQDIQVAKQVIDNAIKFYPQNLRYGILQFVKQLNGGCDIYGDYVDQTDTIRIKVLSDINQMIVTLVHETAHRFWYKFADYNVKKLMSQLYNKVKEDNNYIGKIVKYKDNEYKITKYNSRNLVLTPLHPVEMKIDNKWVSTSEDIKLQSWFIRMFIDEIKSQINYNFPTNYSKTDLNEFQAQCYTAYKIQPNLFTKQTLKAFQNVLAGKSIQQQITIQDNNALIEKTIFQIDKNNPLYHGSQIQRYNDEKNHSLRTRQWFPERQKYLQQAFVIDAYHKKIYRVQLCLKDLQHKYDEKAGCHIRRNGWDDIRDYVNCAYLQRVKIGPNIFLYVDEDGEVKQYNFGFQFKNLSHGRFIGNGVIIKEGKTNLQLSVNMLSNLIEFVGNPKNNSMFNFVQMFDKSSQEYKNHVLNFDSAYQSEKSRLEKIINESQDQKKREEARQKLNTLEKRVQEYINYLQQIGIRKSQKPVKQ